MAGLAVALARHGCRVTYVAERCLSAERKQLGWTVPSLPGVELRYAKHRNEIASCVESAGPDSVHLCQGVRANGLVSYAQQKLANRGLQQYVLMETVDDDGWHGLLKRTLYTALFRRYRLRTTGVLASGQRTMEWVANRGMSKGRVFPFAYFLADRAPVRADSLPEVAPFRFAFVGQFIDRKRFLLLVDALVALDGSTAELVVVGTGPLEADWRDYAERRLPGRVHWHGGLPSARVLELLEEIDCLVLPSRHDGWGAVVSEALMSGTPAICSDHCGAAGAVLASGVGGVFGRDDAAGLTALLSRAIAKGKPSPDDRRKLARWARALGADAGARYLLDILAHMDGTGPRPGAPWTRTVQQCVD